MRGYFLTNMYLSPIQRGIQAAHCMHDMFVTYSYHTTTPAYDKLWEWAESHKTMIVLHGGTSEDLNDVFTLLMNNIEDYPFEKFHEPGIGGALTCVGVVLDERMLDLIKWTRGDNDVDIYVNNYTVAETALADLIARLPLA